MDPCKSRAVGLGARLELDRMLEGRIRGYEVDHKRPRFAQTSSSAWVWSRGEETNPDFITRVSGSERCARQHPCRSPLSEKRHSHDVTAGRSAT